MRREESAKSIDAGDPRIAFDKKIGKAGQGQLVKFQFATT
jgi:hypothetical protein